MNPAQLLLNQMMNSPQVQNNPNLASDKKGGAR